MVDIKIPYKWQPRKYQLDLWRYLENGGKRAVAVWHRRAGKDSLSLNWTVVAAMQRVGVYWHMLPLQTQARKVVWDAIDKQGRRVIDQVFPKALRKSVNAQEMKIELLNGSIWQCVGSDGYNSLVGSNPVGVVFSEYSIADPAAWDFIRPILAENGGWALFIYTPRGRNHGLKLFETAQNSPDWFAQKLGVAETKAIPMTAVDAERAAGMDDGIIGQEFFCSFDAALKGSYYGALLNGLENGGRIGNVPFNPALPVTTAWDLGVGDSTAIWFYQQNGAEVFVIDYYESSGVGLDHYVKVLKEKPYVYTDDNIFPHDIRVHELSSGKSRLDILAGLGVRGRVLERSSVENGEHLRRTREGGHGHIMEKAAESVIYFKCCTGDDTSCPHSGIFCPKAQRIQQGANTQNERSRPHFPGHLVHMVLPTAIPPMTAQQMDALELCPERAQPCAGAGVAAPCGGWLLLPRFSCFFFQQKGCSFLYLQEILIFILSCYRTQLQGSIFFVIVLVYYTPHPRRNKL